MKLLKIEDNCGHYLVKAPSEYKPLNKLDKEGLLQLIEWTLHGEVEFDDFDEQLIKNQAHQIIYRSVLRKLEELHRRREEFTDESERLYLQEYDRYSKSLTEPNG